MDQAPYPLGSPRCYFTSDLPLVELSPCSKDGQGEGEAAIISHQPVSQGIKPGTTESVDREESPEPPAPQFLKVENGGACIGSPFLAKFVLGPSFHVLLSTHFLKKLAPSPLSSDLRGMTILFQVRSLVLT